MFSVNSKVRCVDANLQPTLQEDTVYTVMRVSERGIRVASSIAELPYEYAFRRFVAAEDVQVATNEEDWDAEYVRDGGVYYRDKRYALFFSRDSSGSYGVTFGFVDPKEDERNFTGGLSVRGLKLRTVRSWAMHPDSDKRGVFGLATFGPAPGSRISAPANGTIGSVIAMFWVTPEAKRIIDTTNWE